MSKDCLINNEVTNLSPYTYSPGAQAPLKSGNWIISPQPIAANVKDFLAFQAQGVAGTATGAVGSATYDVIDSGGNNVGSLVCNFSDPFNGDNSASASTTVTDLVASVDIPSDGRTIKAKWKFK